MTIADNVTMTIPSRLGRFGFISPKKRDAFGAKTIRELSVVASGPEQTAGSLSGGNQQKIVMGRALANDPTGARAHAPDGRRRCAIEDDVDLDRRPGAVGRAPEW